MPGTWLCFSTVVVYEWTNRPAKPEVPRYHGIMCSSSLNPKPPIIIPGTNQHVGKNSLI